MSTFCKYIYQKDRYDNSFKITYIEKNEHPEQYEDVEKFIDMGNWFVDEVDKKTKNKTFQCSIRNKIRYHRNMSVPILESVLQEYVKAFCAPPLYTLALLRMGDSYRGMQLFTSCLQNILDME